MFTWHCVVVDDIKWIFVQGIIASKVLTGPLIEKNGESLSISIGVKKERNALTFTLLLRWRYNCPFLTIYGVSQKKSTINNNNDNNNNKVNRCLARYSPRATTTNRPTNRALNKPAWPGQNWPKMPILGQIWSFLGKKSFFLQEKSKVLLPT